MSSVSVSIARYSRFDVGELYVRFIVMIQTEVPSRITHFSCVYVNELVLAARERTHGEQRSQAHRSSLTGRYAKREDVMKIDTACIHAGQEPDPETGAVMSPIVLATTFAQDGPGAHRGYDYSRAGN